MIVYRDEDGNVSVDQFDEKLMVTWELLENLDPRFASVSSDWERLTILDAEYEAVYFDAARKVVGYQRTN